MWLSARFMSGVMVWMKCSRRSPLRAYVTICPVGRMACGAAVGWVSATGVVSSWLPAVRRWRRVRLRPMGVPAAGAACCAPSVPWSPSAPCASWPLEASRTGTLAFSPKKKRALTGSRQ